MKILILLKAFIFIFIFYSSPSFSGDQGMVNSFNKMSAKDQSEKIEKNFDELRKMMVELESIVVSIERTKNKILEVKKSMNKNNGICLALPLLKADMDRLKTKLLKIKSNSEEYERLKKEHSLYNNIYISENANCE